MRRRALLTAVGTGALTLAGCLSAATDGGTPREEPTDRTRSGDDAPGYEECPREVIRYEEFPDDIQTEIDAALGGRYAADRVLLTEAMDVDAAYVAVQGEFYEPTVTVEDGREVLELQHIDPKALPESRPVTVENHRAGERTITVEVVADDGTVLLDETRDVAAGGAVEFGRLARVGTHAFRISVADGDDIEDEIVESDTLEEARFSFLVIVQPDEIVLSGAIAELVPCRFEE